MNRVRHLLPFCLFAGALVAQEPGASLKPPDAEVVKGNGLHFTLVPKAFSRNPSLEMTVNTQLTPFGRTLPEVSAKESVYYIAHDSGYRQMGEVIGEHPPTADALQRDVIAALAQRGYLAADATHPPSLVLFFVWGSHNSMDQDTAAMFPELEAKQELERAVLVGGAKYRQKQSDRMQFGSTPIDNNAKDAYLNYQAQHDLYYAVVSAYDFAALGRNERKLAWRTTMTVNATGVNMTETLPVLLTSSSFYFGRETTEPVAILRDLRRGTVTLGPLKILEPAPEPAPAPQK
jgi:hypothetical protein